MCRNAENEALCRPNAAADKAKRLLWAVQRGIGWPGARVGTHYRNCIQGFFGVDATADAVGILQNSRLQCNMWIDDSNYNDITFLDFQCQTNSREFEKKNLLSQRTTHKLIFLCPVFTTTIAQLRTDLNTQRKRCQYRRPCVRQNHQRRVPILARDDARYRQPSMRRV